MSTGRRSRLYLWRHTKCAPYVVQHRARHASNEANCDEALAHGMHHINRVTVWDARVTVWDA
eukprot:554707-Rhodomonas_salina.1